MSLHQKKITSSAGPFTARMAACAPPSFLVFFRLLKQAKEPYLHALLRCCCQTARHFKVLWVQRLIYVLHVCTMPSTMGSWFWQGCPDAAIINYNYDWLPKSQLTSWGRLFPCAGAAGALPKPQPGHRSLGSIPASHGRGRGQAGGCQVAGSCPYAQGRKKRLMPQPLPGALVCLMVALPKYSCTVSLRAHC